MGYVLLLTQSVIILLVRGWRDIKARARIIPILDTNPRQRVGR